MPGINLYQNITLVIGGKPSFFARHFQSQNNQSHDKPKKKQAKNITETKRRPRQREHLSIQTLCLQKSNLSILNQSPL